MRTPHLLVFPKLSIYVLSVLLMSTTGTTAWCQDNFVRSDEGSGALIEKLVVIESGADFKPHPKADLPKNVEPPKPYSIFWRLKTGTPGDIKDGMYLAGDPLGDPICWIRKEHVRKWRTRFALDPVLPNENIFFTIYHDDKASKIYMEHIGEEGRIPKGHRRLSLITAPSEDRDAEETSMVFPVTTFTGEFEAGGGERGVREQVEMEIENLELGIVFVIDTTASMEPLVDMAKRVIQDVTDIMTRGSGKNVRDAVKFGLVQFRDEGDEFVSEVTLPLTAEPNNLLRVLREVRCGGGGDIPEAVTTGLNTAIAEGGWGKNMSRHIVLLGDAPNRDGFGPTMDEIIKRANPAGGSANQVANRGISISTIASYDSFLPNQVREHFLELTRGKAANYAGQMNVNNVSDIERVTTEITTSLGRSVGGLYDVRMGKEMSAPTKEDDLYEVFYNSFYKIHGTSGPEGDKEVREGFARAYDAKGNRVATKKILVMRDELRRLWSGLDNLLAQFKRLKAGRGNIKAIVDQLRSSVAGTATGDRLEITEATTLEEIIGKDLPMKTNALRITIGNVAIMEAPDFDAFIATLKSAAKRAGALHDQPDQWTKVNELMDGAKADASFLELSDLP